MVSMPETNQICKKIVPDCTVGKEAWHVSGDLQAFQVDPFICPEAVPKQYVMVISGGDGDVFCTFLVGCCPHQLPAWS